MVHITIYTWYVSGTEGNEAIAHVCFMFYLPLTLTLFLL